MHIHVETCVWDGMGPREMGRHDIGFFKFVRNMYAVSC